MAAFGESHPGDLRQENIRLPARIRRAVRTYARRRHIGLADAYRLLLDLPCELINRGGDPLAADEPETAA